MSTTTSLSPRDTSVSPKKREDTPTPSPRSPRSLKSPAVTRIQITPSKQSATGIPMPVRNTKHGSLANTRPSSQSVSRISTRLARPSSGALKGNSASNKHTLEIQFINKKKRLSLLKKDLLEKQKPVLDLYQNLVQIKKRLEDLGKVVFLEEFKFYDGESDRTEPEDGGGESISPEMVIGMQTSIEEIPNTLMDICRNLLGRRNVIVELLENIMKSEVDVSDLSEQIQTLKSEGAQLQSNLDLVINEHHQKIKEIVGMWHSLLHDKRKICTGEKVSELEEKLKVMERLREESNNTVQDLQRRLDDKRSGHDRYVNELNNTIGNLKEHIKKLEHDLESEKKAALDYRTRNNTNAQNSKMLRGKITELENEKKSLDSLNNDLNRKLKIAQEQLKNKESQWAKERDELSKSLKHQENLLQKLNADKTSFETRLESAEVEKSEREQILLTQLDAVTGELNAVKSNLETVNKEKKEAVEKCAEMEEHIARMGVQHKEAMNMLTKNLDWGKDVPNGMPEAQEYSQSMMKDIMIREFQDKIRKLEEDNNDLKRNITFIEETKVLIPTETEKDVMMKHDLVIKYKTLLAETEQKLSDKFQELAKLTAEVRHLKVRQEHLEELNQKCPAENLMQMVEDGRSKLTELMKKSFESEQKIVQCQNVIEKQSKEMNEMENLLRYRENMAGVLKASRDELLIEKDSLIRYSHETRAVLSQMKDDAVLKEQLIKELQEKIELRERRISKLEKDVAELKNNLVITNEKRFKLQETIGKMEKELQSTKAHLNQVADMNTRYEIDTKTSNTVGMLNEPECRKKASRTVSDIYAFLENLESGHRSIHTPCCDVSSSTHDFCRKKIIIPANIPPKISIPSFLAQSALNLNTYTMNKKIPNSRSLISLSLKQVDFLKSRLDHLTKVNLPTIVSKDSFKNIISSNKKDDSKNRKYPNENLVKCVELQAKRYELLQKQAYDSYEELTNLVKMAVSNNKVSE